VLHVSPKISIGLPIHNGSTLYNNIPLIRQRLDSILSQTFTDFELIISDNASTDSTPEICQEYAKKDKRIKYFRQEIIMDFIPHFKSVLEKTNCEYFIFCDHEDRWEPTFLEKNLDILETNKKFIASFSRTSRIGPGCNNIFKIDSHDTLIKKYYKKIRLFFRKQNKMCSITGSYDKKIRTCLHQFHATYFMYSVFRTKILKKATQTDGPSWDWVVLLKSLQYGDINLIDEVLYSRYIRNTANLTNTYTKDKISLSNLFFHGLPFTTWFYRYFGVFLFLKNLDYFVILNLSFISIIFVIIFQKFQKYSFWK